MKRFVLTLTSMATLALLAAPAADALIQINRGVAGARLGNSKQQVRTALGQPNRIVNGTNDFGPFTVFRYRGGVRVTFQSGNDVTGVTTVGLGDRTARGVGVRSTLQAVRSRVSGVSCQQVPGGRICQVGAGLPGQRVTAFFIRNGRVTRVTVAFVID